MGRALRAEIAFTSDTFVAVKADRVWLAAVQVEGYQPPTWPGGASPKQMRLDLAVDDLEQSGTEAVGLGATRDNDAAVTAGPYNDTGEVHLWCVPPTRR
ncbi:MAG: VOC family protein [Acidimicrobiales bacterium]